MVVKTEALATAFRALSETAAMAGDKRGAAIAGQQ